MVFWTGEGVKAEAWGLAVAAAAGAEECIFFECFSKDSEVTFGTFAVHFWTSFRHEIRLCFGVVRGCGEGLKAEAWSLAVAAAAGAEECIFFDLFWNQKAH